MDDDDLALSPLEGYRALDLTDENGLFCGRLLADLGMDVIKIERPGGHPTRDLGPSLHPPPIPGQSLYQLAYNQGKRGITLNLAAPDGLALFAKLVRRADVLIESSMPGSFEALGLGYNDLQKLNRGLIYTSITPFGQLGPYARYRSCDLVTTALSGWLSLTGDPDRAPLATGFPQSYLTAGADAAAATLIALFHRERTGEGQRVDVSAQASLVPELVHAIPAWDLNGALVRRSGPLRSGLSQGGLPHRFIWTCLDGYVVWYHVGGSAGAASTEALVRWMADEGISNPLLDAVDWRQTDMAKITHDLLNAMEEALGRFFASRSKGQLYAGAVQRRIMIFPVATPAELLQSEQLEARGFWQEIDHPELGRSLRYPGPFVRFLEGRLPAPRPAPALGQHNREVYEDELALSNAELLALRQAGVI